MNGLGLMRGWGRFVFWQDLRLEIACDGKNQGYDKGREDGCAWRLRAVEWPVRKNAPIACSSVDERDWYEQSDKRVEAERFSIVAAKESGEGAGASAAGAEDVQVLMDRALRVEAVLRRWEEDQQCSSGQQDRHRRNRSCEVHDAAASGCGHD